MDENLTKITNNPEETLLKAKREAFCVAFTEIGNETFGNATKSAIAADYSENSARTQGWRLLKNIDVKRRILELYNEKLRDNNVTQNSVLANLMHDRILARQAGQYSVAVRCTELEGKYLSMFTDRLVNVDPEKEQARRKINAEELKQLERLARIRTKELSRAQVVKFPSA